MSGQGVTVAIPVGPDAVHAQWLDEAIASVRAQTYPVAEILIIDDMHGVPPQAGDDITIWRAPWRLGVAHAFNFGVALATNDVVFLLGSDDTLAPECIERCLAVYEQLERPGNNFFFVGVKYDDGRADDEQFLPCGAAMVTKRLWRLTGGFPVESSTGASDAAFCSTFLNRPDVVQFVGVCGGRTLYNCRIHPGMDTARLADWQDVIIATRHQVTLEWRPPTWTERCAVSR